MSLLTRVKQWNEAAKNGQIKWRRKQCPRCGSVPKQFTRHQCRERTFLVLVGDLVCKVLSYALRWKCPICGATFTTLPPFAVPRKRYVRQTILGQCNAYLEDKEKDRTSYRDLFGGSGYDSLPNGDIDERRPSHTRVWYWLKDLGETGKDLGRAKGLIRDKDPSSEAVGRATVIAPYKYRSLGRREVLKAALSLLRIDQEWVRLFEINLPTEFGTVFS